MGSTRVVFSAAERREMFARWRAGESQTDISRALGRQTGSVYGHLVLHGGIEPRERSRYAGHLTVDEREEISRGLAAEDSYRAIARRLGRQPSTISREVERNGGRKRYRAALADRAAWKRAERPQACKLGSSERLRRAVAAKLELQWSPE